MLAQAAGGVDGKMEELNKTDVCNNTIMPAGSFQRLGPAELYESLGPFILLPLYCSLGLFATFLWSYAIYWRSRVVGGELATTLLQFLPVLNLTLTLPLFLSPPTTPLVSLIQDIVAVSAMFIYTQFSLRLLGGSAKVAENLSSSKCPLGTPPLCCLLPCPKPNVSPTLFSVVLIPLRLLTVALTINFLVNLFLVFSGFYPVNRADDFGNLLNLHNILIIPFFVSTMYTYKVMISLLRPLMVGTFPRMRGMLNFQMFVGCKTVLGIMGMLESEGVIGCLPGVPSNSGAAIIAGMAQVAFLCPACLLLPRLYARDWDQVRARISQADSKDLGNDVDDENCQPLVVKDPEA